MKIEATFPTANDFIETSKGTIILWANEHIKELHKILETGKCFCGEPLEDNTLHDYGFNYGIDCEKCR